MPKTIRIVYRKPTGSFITIESKQENIDKNYVYLQCGKYLRKNIISYTEIEEKAIIDETLTDDA